MNTSNPHDYQQQQQQQQQAYGTRRHSSANTLLLQKSVTPIGSNMSSPPPSSLSSSNLAVPTGRPLPKTPPGHDQQQQQQQYYMDASVPASSMSTGHLQTGPYQMSSGANSSSALQLPGSASTRTSRVNIHISQPSSTSIATMGGSGNTVVNDHSAKSNLGYGANSRNYSSWVQPKTTTTASSTSTAYSTGSTVLNGKKSQQLLSQQQQQQQQQQQPSSLQPPGMSLEEASAYHAALTRPISPTIIMNYLPPPTTNSTTTTSSSSIRPISATAALSSSFNTLGPGAQPAQRPVMAQGARSSYINPTTGGVAGNSAPPPPSQQQQQQQQYMSPRQQQTKNNNQGSAGIAMTSEEPGSNSSRFARRGPLVSQESSAGGSGDTPGTRSRRESTYSDTESLQQFSPAMLRSGEASECVSPAAGNLGMQLQVAKEGWLWRRGNLLTWKRCYAIGRYRGDAHPGVLTLFKDNEHLFPIKTIDMSECYEVQVKAYDTKGTGRFEFKVVTRKEETWFATDTMTERTGWIDALNSLMAKVVGASLLKLEAKLNTIRHRNNSLEYAHTALSTEKATLEEHLQLVQQDLVSRENQLTQRELELERKRVESLVVQLEAWRAAAKVTVNQHYAVRDQLLERVMKTARTVQELVDRAKIHLDTGADQVTEVIKSHLECLKVHVGELGLNGPSQKMIKSILVGLTVNLDTRSSEIKRVLLVLDQHTAAAKMSSSTSNSSPSSPRAAASPSAAKDRRLSMGPIPSSHPPPSTLGIGVHILQLREKYTETLLIIEEGSKRLKRILERSDVNNTESGRRFYEEICEALKGLLKLPVYSFVPCLPDQPLPGAADTFYREDLIQIQQKGQELLRKSSGSNTQAQDSRLTFKEPPPAANSSPEPRESQTTNTETSLPQEPESSTLNAPSIPKGPAPASQPAPVKERGALSTMTTGPPTLSLALPESLSSFLFTSQQPVAATGAAVAGSVELTQKLRDTILPEFDHLSIKQEESLQAMTALLNQVSAALVSKLGEIKEATHNQRQEFEELKDEIIDVMQLSATDPSAHQRDISALSEIRSKLAEITGQLENVQAVQGQQQPQLQGLVGLHRNGSYRRLGTTPQAGQATATGISLLQRSASTMVHSSTGGIGSAYYHTIDSGSRNQFQHANNNSSSLRPLSPLSGKQPKIAGMARLFEDGPSMSSHAGYPAMMADRYDDEGDSRSYGSHSVVSKLDQLLLLLEFVNTAQCRMMAYQDLQFDKSKEANVDDGRMMAVQEHMEQMDKKINQQMNLLKRIVGTEGRPTIVELSESEAAQSSDSSESLPEGLDENGTSLSTKHQHKDDLTLFEVLNRLDLQVIPSVQDQSNRIYELSDQLSEMKRQLDEQQRRLQETTSTLASAPTARPRVATSNSVVRSNSLEGSSAVALPHSRSGSQISLQQQSSIPGSVVSSPLDVESPALWRASLRPSNSTSSSASLSRDRLSGSQSTSDRIAEMLDRMDARMTSVIDEQLARYEKGNKELLAKVFELLDADDDDEEEDESAPSQGMKRSGSKKALAASSPQRDLEDRHGPQWPTEPFDRLKDLILQEADRSENSLNDQRDELLEKLNYLQSSIQESQAMDSLRQGTVQEELRDMRDWIVTHSSRQTENLRDLLQEMTLHSAPPTSSQPTETSAMTVEFREEGEGGVDAVLSSLDTIDLTNGRTTATAQKGQSQLDEAMIREVIQDQLEMFTRVQMATFSEMSDNLNGVERMMRDMAKMMGLRRGGTILRKKEAEEGRAMLAMEVKETIEEVMTRRISSLSPAASSASVSSSLANGTLPRAGSMDGGILSGATSPQEPTPEGSAKQPNGSGSGLFKYLYQPRRSISLATGMEPSSTAATPPRPASFTNGSTKGSTPLGAESNHNLLRRSSGELAFAEEDHAGEPTDDDERLPCKPKKKKSLNETPSLGRSSTDTQELSMEWVHDQLEALYKRKARAEIEVEDLVAKKDALRTECDALQRELEELRTQKAMVA
ncbi:hypothetical protein EMPS_03909 [Entomortierella parvispora]|uniref:PH domain-containing protein n=1 Tax=Entomortierella parvispora TaxID=205924 RepID=A0A9P3LV32_9FUNG|nr:hypothetical protein EMPS_03909 [Entomortierella parvispora]